MKLFLILCLILLIHSSYRAPVSQVRNLNSGAAGSIVSNYTILLDQYYYVATTDGGEMVHFTGQVHITTISFPTDPVKYFPNDPLRISTNLIGVRGIGETTGLSYELVGATTASGSFVTGSNYYQFSYLMLPPSPIVPLSRSILGSYVLEFDSAGQLLQASVELQPAETI